MKVSEIRAVRYNENLYAVDLVTPSVGRTLHAESSLDMGNLRLAKELEKAVAEEYGLKNYYEWKKWLLADQQECKNSDYPDNWLFAEAKDNSHETLATFDAFGACWYLVKTEREHKICGKKFFAYEIFSDKESNYCEALCGFQF